MASPTHDMAKQLWQSFDQEDGAKPYADKLASILGKISLKDDRLEGLALMAILEIGEIFLPSGETLEDPVAFIPNLQMIASVPALYLDGVSDEVYWWRFQYLAWANDDEQNRTIADLIDRLTESGAIKSVSGFRFLA